MDIKRIITALILCLFLAVFAYGGPQNTSSTTGTAMIAKVRNLIDEDTALRWTDADLLQYLNSGMVDIAAKTLCYQTTESINLVADTIEYTPTTTYYAVIAVILNPATGDSLGLSKGNISSVNNSRDFDGPTSFYEFGGKVGVYPAYSSVTTETVTVYFARQPTTITAGQNILTPAVFDNALMYYIASQALIIDGRVNEANGYKIMYVQELNRYRNDFVGVDNETSDPIR